MSERIIPCPCGDNRVIMLSNKCYNCGSPVEYEKHKEPTVSYVEFFKASDFEGAITATDKNSRRNCADIANRILTERGTVVRSHGDKGMWQRTWPTPCDSDDDGCDHTALLVNIQPIAKDTAESLLREIMDEYERDEFNESLFERTKTFLERKRPTERAKALLEGK